ncbi:hypothetical protein MTO96_012249 [Rhipicephalus appendiculatus]
MFTLLSGLWKYISQRDEYYVLILGLDNAGKTTYLEQTKTKFSKGYKALNPHKITTTVGLNIGKIDIHGIRLNFWDLGGQDSLQSLWDKYYAESHAVIYVVDSSNASPKMVGNDALHGVPILMVANKQDISGCYSAAEIRQLFRESSHLIGRRDCHLIGASALHGEGINEGIEWITQCVKRNILRPPRTSESL